LHHDGQHQDQNQREAEKEFEFNGDCGRYDEARDGGFLEQRWGFMVCWTSFQC